MQILTDIEKLSFGTLKLPAKIHIGRNAYMITKDVDESPNYLGYSCVDPLNSVIIKTNRYYSLFQDPSDFVNQRKRLQKSGILMDFDNRHLILVYLNVLDLREKIKYLWTGAISFPFTVMVERGIYVLTGKVSQSNDFIEYTGHYSNNVQLEVIVKVFSQIWKYSNELEALKVLGRLYSSNRNLMVLVSKPALGIPIVNMMSEIYKDAEYMLEVIDSLKSGLTNLHMKTNLIHGNVNLFNVLFDHENGEVHFKNFENSKVFSSWDANQNQNLIQRDYLELENSVKNIKLIISALQHPLSLDAQKVLMSYVSEIGRLFGIDCLSNARSEIRAKQLDLYSKKPYFMILDKSRIIGSLLASRKIYTPKMINIGINIYQINDYISSGAQGMAYRGHIVNNPNEKVVFKFYRFSNAQKTFQREVYILALLGRLYDEDHKNLVTVQKEISGDLLSEYLKNTHRNSQKAVQIMKDVTQLLSNFHSNWGIAHNDVRPENIIRKPDGVLELIDFGFSRILSESATESEQQIRRDFQILESEFEYFYLGLEALDALNDPLNEYSENTVLEYVRVRLKRGDKIGANNFMKRFKSLKTEQYLAQSRPSLST